MGASDLPANCVAGLIYDGTVFQVINFGGTGGTGTNEIYQINIPYTVDSSVTRNTVIADFSAGAGITTYAAGLIFMVKIANTNTTFANINVNSLGLRPIYAQGGSPNYPLLPGDIQAGDVLVFTYDGTQFWVYANTNIAENVGFTVSNNTQISELFVALGRKRIMTSGYVTITLATGVYSPFNSYHADADRIKIQGTMLAAAPVQGNFFRSGSSDANRASDSANNLVMLRARYGTEIRFDNSVGFCVRHTGPGAIVYSGLLFTGANVPCAAEPNFVNAIGPARGSAMICSDVSVWGSGGFGFTCQGGVLTLSNCYACSCAYAGFCSTEQGVMNVNNRGGSYGNARSGVYLSNNAMVYGNAWVNHPQLGTLPGFEIMYNASLGVQCSASTAAFAYATIIGNPNADMYATDMGVIAHSYSTVGPTSPAANTEGNLNSICRVYA
jgi:hypothetical protein